MTKGTQKEIKQQLGASEQKRLNKKPIPRICDPVIARLARKAGIEFRISKEIYESIRTEIDKFTEDILRDAVILVQSQNKKTIGEHQMMYAIKRHGYNVYGVE